MDEKQEPTQQTPAGATIPVPTRKQVFDDLAKVARPIHRPADDDAQDESTESD